MGGGDLVSKCYSYFPIFAMANTNESLVVNLALYLMWSLSECKLIQYYLFKQVMSLTYTLINVLIYVKLNLTVRSKRCDDYSTHDVNSTLTRTVVFSHFSTSVLSNGLLKLKDLYLYLAGYLYFQKSAVTGVNTQTRL